jgi:hypothetical protein
VKLLSAESKPLSPSEYKAIWHGEVEQEPEWRPMSEAPRDGTMIKAINSIDVEIKVRFNHKYCPWRDDNHSGWAVEDLKGWRLL